MRYIPVLDDAYMARRRKDQELQFYMERSRQIDENLAAMRPTKTQKARRRPDSLEAAKERFVDGKLSLEEFEAEVDRLFERDAS